MKGDLQAARLVVLIRRELRELLGLDAPKREAALEPQEFAATPLDRKSVV